MTAASGDALSTASLPMLQYDCHGDEWSLKVITPSDCHVQTFTPGQETDSLGFDGLPVKVTLNMVNV